MLNGTRTWSPTFSFCTSSPSCSTTPVNSWPNVIPTLVSGTEPPHKRRVHSIDEPPRHSVGGIVQVSDIRHGGAKRPYKVIKVGSIIYHSDTAGDLQAAINNRTYYVTDT